LGRCKLAAGWFAILTLTDYGRIARENEAAGAADAAAWVMSGCSDFYFR